ncbi:MAG TPA: acetate uptake transporter [Solirubrobacteraceae bacterium]|nr:acetate uptake transporter [Solirubrobacteraceae bacterium]
MEAANIGAREADVAPAPVADPYAGRTAGWTPANPAPLGLAGFAATTFMLSMINADLVSHTALAGVLGLALAYGGIAQLIAGIWEFRTGNTFGAVAFCSYGAFWISFYFLVTVGLKGVPVRELDSVIGLYLWTWGIFTSLMFFASLRTTGAVAIVFLLLAITFIVLGIGNSALAGGTATINGTVKLGGWLGIATAIAAWYTAIAAVLESTFARTVLPVFPLNR